MAYYLTSDEHYGHNNIISYTKRPFENVDVMDEVLIQNHNSLVQPDDIVIHAGDFTLAKKEIAESYIRRLNGRHIFVKGSHDRWLGNRGSYLLEKTIEGVYVVVCHYAMRVWPRSHYGSIQCYGHSHNKLPPLKNQIDVGVDAHNYFPVSLEKVKEKLGICNCIMCNAAKELKRRT